MAKMRKHSLFRDLILLGVGGTLAITGAVGGIVGGTALLAGSISGKSIENATRMDDLLSEEYENKNIIELIRAIAKGEIDYHSLQGLSEVSPKVNELYNGLESVLTNLGFDLALDKETIYNLNFDQYQEYFTTTFLDNLTLASILRVNTESKKILQYLCYDKDAQGNYDYNSPTTIRELLNNSNFISEKIDGLVINDIFDEIPEDNHLMNAISNWSIADFSNTENIYGLHVYDIYGEGGDGIIGAISAFTIKQLGDQSELEKLVVGSLLGDTKTPVETNYDNPEVVISDHVKGEDDGTLVTFTIHFSNGETFSYTRPTGTEEPSKVYLAEDGFYYVSKDSENRILSALTKYRLSTLKNDPSTLRKTIKIGDVVGDIPSSNSVLKAIKDYTIDELSNGVIQYDEDGNPKVDEHGDVIKINIIKTLKLVDILGSIPEDNYALNAISPYTIDEMINGIDVEDPVTHEIKKENVINNLKLKDIFGEIKEEDKESNPLRYAIQNMTLTELSKDGALNGLKIEDIVGSIPENNYVMTSLKGYTIDQLVNGVIQYDEDGNPKVDEGGNPIKVNVIDTLKLENIVGSDAVSASPLLNALSDKTISALKNPALFDSIPLKDIMGEVEQSNAVLYSLVNYTYKDDDDNVVYMSINDLKDGEKIKDAVKNLKIKDVVGNVSGSFLDLIGEYTIEDLSGDKIENELSVGQMMGNLNTHIPNKIDDVVNPLVSNVSYEEIKEGETTVGHKYRITFENGDELHSIPNHFEYEVMDGDEAKPKGYYVGIDGNYWVRMKDGSNLFNLMENWTLNDLKDESVVNSIKVVDLLGLSDKTMDELKEQNPIVYAMKDLSVGTLTEDNVKNAINQMELSAFLSEDAKNNPLLKVLADKKIGELESKIKELTFNDIVANDDPLRNQPIFDSLKYKYVKDFANTISNLTLGDLVGYDVTVKSHEFISSDELVDRYQITFIDNSVSPATEIPYNYQIQKGQPKANVYVSSDGYYWINSNNTFSSNTGVKAKVKSSGLFKYLDPTTKLTGLTEAINTAKLTTLLQDDILEDRGGVKCVKPIWKFLLTPSASIVGLSDYNVSYESDPNKDYYDSYTIQQMSELITNFEYNIQNATLSRLQEIGILGQSGAELVTKPLGAQIANRMNQYYASIGSEKVVSATTTYGELKLTEIITILNVFDQF